MNAMFKVFNLCGHLAKLKHQAGLGISTFINEIHRPPDVIRAGHDRMHGALDLVLHVLNGFLKPAARSTSIS